MSGGSRESPPFLTVSTDRKPLPDLYVSTSELNLFFSFLAISTLTFPKVQHVVQSLFCNQLLGGFLQGRRKEKGTREQK